MYVFVVQALAHFYYFSPATSSITEAFSIVATNRHRFVKFLPRDRWKFPVRSVEFLDAFPAGFSGQPMVHNP